MNHYERACILVRLPEHLKRAIVEEVEARDTCLNDLLVGVLADHYGVPFEPSNRRGHPARDTCGVLLRMSDRLKRRIQRDALNARTDMTDVIVRLLAHRFGVIAGPRRSTRTSPFGGGARKTA